MEIRSFGASGAARIALSLFVVGAASGASAQLSMTSMPPQFIQMNTYYEPSGQRQVAPVGEIDTFAFFPQIDRTIGQRGFKRAPSDNGVRFGRNNFNTMPAGKIGGSTHAVPESLFPGINYTGWIPADPHIGTGPGHIVQVVNSSIAFFNKSTGVSTFQQASIQFFAGSGATSSQFDPRVIYDQFNSRWIILYLALDEGSGISQFCLAASDDSDPNGTWRRFVLDTAQEIATQDCWFDYPMIGYSEDAIVISGNMFPFSGGPFTACSSWVIPTAGLYDNTGATATNFLDDTTFNIRPAYGHTAGSTTIYGFCADTFTQARLYAFTGVDTATPAMVSTNLPTQNCTFLGSAPSGGSGQSSTVGFRSMDASYRDGSLVAAHSVALIGDNKTSVRWYEFDLGSWPTSGLPSVAQQGNITLGAGQWAYMPAITKNVFGDISVIYTRSSTAIFSDLVVSTRVVSDPAGTMGPPTLLRGGLGPNTVGRWGDYFAAVTDPDDDATFWGNGMVTRADGVWNTEIQSWVVTAGGGGGGGGGVDYDTIAVSAFMGAYNSGGLTEVTASDNLTFDVDSVLRPGQGHFGAIQADFLIAEPGSNVTSLTFTVEGNVDPGVTATGMVFLWNWNTNQFEYGKAFDVQKVGNDQQGTKIKDNPGRFVSGTGQVRMVFRAHDPFRRRGTSPSPFRLRTDLIKLNVKT